MHFTFRKISTFSYFLRQKKYSFFVFFRSDFLSFLLDSIMFYDLVRLTLGTPLHIIFYVFL